MNRPITTLFMLMSVDGKISTGDTDVMDFDRDLPHVSAAKQGLTQYYELEKQTDLFSFNTGRVMAKIGANTNKQNPSRLPVSFVIIDNKPHLTKKGVRWLSHKVQRLILVSTNKKHPAAKSAEENIAFVHYPKSVELNDLFFKLKSTYGVKRITVQSGGTMNAELVRSGLIDYVAVVVAPILIGGKSTSTLMDGEALHRVADLKKIVGLKLTKCARLNHNYFCLKYRVIG